MFYSNEIVFRGHPDKVADQISDAILDAYLAKDRNSRCGIEVVGGKDMIFVTGEVTSTANVDIEAVAKKVLRDVGYTKNYAIINNIGKQSPDIARGVDVGGAGDQGMMFGFACRDTQNHIPLAMNILQIFSMYYDSLRRSDSRFLPDGKAQIVGCYDENNKLRYIKDFIISYQNTEVERKETDQILIDFCRSLCHQFYISIENFHINPTGKFLIGGFDGDAGLTGRKLCVDNYHSFAPIGGGAFSGKDATKVDRSAAYKARQIAIDILNSNEDGLLIGLDNSLKYSYLDIQKDWASNFWRRWVNINKYKLINLLDINNQYGSTKISSTNKTIYTHTKDLKNRSLCQFLCLIGSNGEA